MLEKIITYFVNRTEGNITKTQLIYFLYLVDLGAVKWQEKQITDLEWCYYYSGPYSDGINTAIDNLILIDNITEYNFPKGLELRLDNIVREWQNSEVSELRFYIYNTEPLKFAIAQHKPRDKTKLNLSLEHDKLVRELGE